MAIAEILPLSLFNDRKFYSTWLPSAPTTSILILIAHGMLAFALNIANFNAVKEGGPLMMNVVGNVKQVVMILLSVFMFGNKIKMIGIVGSVICIAGSMWYTYGAERKGRVMRREHQAEQDDGSGSGGAEAAREEGSGALGEEGIGVYCLSCPVVFVGEWCLS